eukprot:897093-Rhodomonas_salina.2
MALHKPAAIPLFSCIQKIVLCIYTAADVKPECLSSASGVGARPRNALNTSFGSSPPPFARIVSLNLRPISCTCSKSRRQRKNNAL